MKKLLSVIMIAAAVASVAGCGKKAVVNYIVTGDVEGVEGEIYLIHDKDTVNTTVATDGKFIFSGELPEPGVYYVMSRLPMVVLLDEGDSAHVAGSVIKFKPGERLFNVTGSDANEELAELSERMMEIMTAMRDAASMEQRDSVMQVQSRLIVGEADDNIDNVLGLYLLSLPQQMPGVSADEMEAVLVKTPERLQKTSMYEAAVKRIGAMREQEERKDGQPAE